PSYYLVLPVSDPCPSLPKEYSSSCGGIFEGL
ncbi:hypothetical protein A2U01_0117264, partial [Trifolium medium]|nr:hypothetical protein [Trifolium medium]